ncbi:GAF domain-containing protein [Myxosarcina sp. GI1]|uniref:GAF domain-containing protein n=1 Tax=Myxosarcina sp. GI1 TaxID=1541065 RepID=UPI00068C3C12|nr:GAF domain-containing protein [Myxosarcina sp. GI1]
MDLSTTLHTENSSETNLENGSQSSANPSKTEIVQKIKKNLFKQERERLWKVLQRIRQSKDSNSLLNNTTKAIQSELKADRVVIYRFDDESNGQIVAEALTSGWTPALEQTIPGNCFGGQSVADYQSKGYVAIANVASSSLTPYQKQLLEGFQIKSSLAVPIVFDSFLPDNANTATNVWGLLVVQQCSQPRQWQEDEINLLDRLSIELSRALQPPLPKLQSGSEDLVGIIDREIHHTMQRMLHEIRQSMKADRVLIYGFNPDWSGEVLAESVDSQWTKAGDSFNKDCFITTENHKPYYVVNNIDAQNVAPCLKESVAALQAKAYIAVSVKAGDRLMGILTVYQNSEPRNWQPAEIEQMQKYAERFSHPLKQISSTRHLKFQAKKFEQFSQQDFLTSINNEAREQMQNLLDKVRASMKLDRAAVFGFNPDWSGKVLAESFGSSWNPMGSVLDKDFHFKGGEFESYYIANDVQSKGLARAVLEKFEQMQARAYIVVPIHANNQLLGVLGVYQNSGSRNWQESDVKQVKEFAARLVLPLQQTSYLRNIEFQSQQMDETFKREKSLSKILEKVRLAKEEKAAFQIATTEGRKILDVDRVAIYRFNEDYSGNFIAESVAPGWTSLLDTVPFIEDTFLQNTKGGRYKNGECFSVEDIYLTDHKACHIELLEQMEARAYVIAPVFLSDSNMFASKKLWGLIAVYQNTGARRWQNYEVETVRQLGLQVGIAIQQISYLDRFKKQAEQEKASNRIIERIRKAQDIDEIFKVATDEMRHVLKTDRAIVYQFNQDWSGQVIAESVAGGWVSLLVEQQEDKVLSGNRTQNDRCILRKWAVDDITDTDTYFERTRGGKYAKGKKFTAVDDIYKQKFPDCYISSLEKYQARAYIIAPIFQGEELWGLLGVYQNSGTRTWEESETEQMIQIASQLAVALQQAEYINKLKQQAKEQAIAAERAKTTTDLIDKIRQSQNIDSIFKVTTKEVRKVLQADRCIVYQFEEDWSGQVVAESVAGDWVSLLVEQKSGGELEEVVRDARVKNDRCILRKWGTKDITVTDTYFEDTREGNKYAQGQKFTAVDDIYTQGFPDCYVESLEKYQARAYILVPIFQGEKLWGLLGIYQNSGTRAWQKTETQLMVQIANQLAVALQQATYLDRIQAQSAELEATIKRERAAKEELQKQAVEMLRTVRPAFTGDLTVRAQVTENEIGTIAGAYNTTLDSLKGIVMQVQEAAAQVAQTTSSSSNAVDGLSLQSQKQLQELNQALSRVQAMIDASTVTTNNAQRVEMAIEQADRTVQAGDAAMNDTVDSIVSLRQTVAEAGKRVKSLSDSSQKISKVVSLIGTFATQTNLLALNAALEATRAGEYGKGFAVVADEVRNLSLQSSEATTEIEKLVREIQEETQEVAAAMEAGVVQVAEGTDLVTTTRKSLNEIVTATAEIRTLVRGITSAANAQTQEAESVTAVMGQVAEIANETTQDSSKISASFQQLEQLAQNLQASVSQFKVK